MNGQQCWQVHLRRASRSSSAKVASAESAMADFRSAPSHGWSPDDALSLHLISIPSACSSADDLVGIVKETGLVQRTASPPITLARGSQEVLSGADIPHAIISALIGQRHHSAPNRPTWPSQCARLWTSTRNRSSSKIFASNIGGTATLIAFHQNPIGSAAGLLHEFLLHLGPAACWRCASCTAVVPLFGRIVTSHRTEELLLRFQRA